MRMKDGYFKEQAISAPVEEVGNERVSSLGDANIYLYPRWAIMSKAT